MRRVEERCLQGVSSDTQAYQHAHLLGTDIEILQSRIPTSFDTVPDMLEFTATYCDVMSPLGAGGVEEKTAE